MSNQKSDVIYTEAVLQDREEKKQLVVDTISSHCRLMESSSSSTDDLKWIKEALVQGDILVADIVTGGWCNFSYRVYLKRNPEIQVYVKLAFPRALWDPNPDAYFDTQRIEKEFHMMKLYHHLNPGSVAIPYTCIDVDTMKLLITQWSPSDEQFANQFIDGVVDIRYVVIPCNRILILFTYCWHYESISTLSISLYSHRVIVKLAQGLAKLNSIKDFDPNYGSDVKEVLKGYMNLSGQSMIKSLFDADQVNMDQVSAFAKELGLDTCLQFMEGYLLDIYKSESLGHSDSHVFNILVEKKPDISTLEHFGPNGSYALCDWEMAMSCSLGRDIGLLYAYPIACIMAHAINGNNQFSIYILNCLDVLWTEYASALIQIGEKTEMDLKNAYHTVLGQADIFLLFVYYFRGLQMEYLPLEGDTTLKSVRESLGYIGLFCLNLVFSQEYSDVNIDVLQEKFNTFVRDEIGRKLPIRPSRPSMRSSLLRTSGRRVSDAAVFASIFTKLSTVEN